MRSCTQCRALLNDEEGPCRYCGATLGPRTRDENPYEAPASSAFGPTLPSEVLVVEPTWTGKAGQALVITARNLPLLTLVTWTIGLPLVLAVILATESVAEERRFEMALQVQSLFQGIFGPIATAATIWVLAQSAAGRPAGYAEAMSVGLRCWGRLWSSLFLAGMVILLGLLMLVVPGIIHALRLALVAPVVVLEGAGPTEARARSRRLMRRREWAFLGTRALLFLLALSGQVLIAGLPLPEGPVRMLVGGLWAEVLAIPLIVSGFLYYQEARETESAVPGLDWDDDPTAAMTTKSGPEVGP